MAGRQGSRLWERYVESQLDYKAGADVLKGKLAEAGSDAAVLLAWVRSLSDSAIGAGEKIQLLQRVWAGQFELVDQGTVQPKKELTSDRVHNPHEPEAHHPAKGQGAQKKEHVGYKVQVAETVREQKLAAAQAQGRELMGPAARAPHNNGGKYTTEAFQITVEERQAICPAGQENSQCGRIENQQTGEVTCRFEWSRHCAGCALREQCVGAGQKHRRLVVTEHHPLLQARRQEQHSESFGEEMKQRNAIEGTQSGLVRAHGLRRARYRGLAKVRLQNYFIGAACNAKRWIKRMIGEMKAPGASLEPALHTG